MLSKGAASTHCGRGTRRNSSCSRGGGGGGRRSCQNPQTAEKAATKFYEQHFEYKGKCVFKPRKNSSGNDAVSGPFQESRPQCWSPYPSGNPPAPPRCPPHAAPLVKAKHPGLPQPWARCPLSTHEGKAAPFLGLAYSLLNSILRNPLGLSLPACTLTPQKEFHSRKQRS